ncbi:hypothetical protein [Actinomadura alba]|uniref:Uncharacterized protein n=1 Tax=Actinomadura alba TaxID=406431 RepID=A0ABR7LSX8_9ACTN|nr:hypothetical protein [Actinomadura alba]MBC6467865.1 hypothetical protein [Actinomadura alba]
MAGQTGAEELHFTATEAVASRARFTRDDIYMGGALYPPETVQSVTTAARVRGIIAAAG